VALRAARHSMGTCVTSSMVTAHQARMRRSRAGAGARACLLPYAARARVGQRGDCLAQLLRLRVASSGRDAHRQ
jgi:hypothetical protein